MPPKVIAFYLPQFHRIPENDAWWGEGYTEWVDVRRAVPRFEGHLQPRLPTELGFYDLTDTAVQEKQSEIAQRHGIFGFCYYYFWFGGRQLLQKPLQNMLANPQVRIPFCLCFANESWTRIWEGRDEILIKQEHNAQDDRAFFRNLVPYMSDPRYIRIGGKPLLLVYQTKLFGNAERTADIWRDEARKHGIGEIYLCRCESYFDFTPPSAVGFDASYEFPPHGIELAQTTVRGRAAGFDGGVFEYASCIPKTVPWRPYKRFRGVMTGFDNSPKMRKGSWVFVNSSPALYLEWLIDVLKNTVETHPSEEQLVFVNAWNEWGEGAILEPCSRFGDRYLKATKVAVKMFSRQSATAAGRLM
jgi:lipopolysaccharide biosynthesis protein